MESIQYKLRIVAGACAIGAAARAAAQDVERRITPAEATAGSEAARYYRALQLVGAVPDPSVTLGYSPRQLRALATTTAAHPWAAMVTRDTGGPGPCRAEVRALPISGRVTWNSGFPFAYNEGPVWAGKGATFAASAGAAACVGPVTASLRPVAFTARNAAYPIVSVPEEVGHPYADASYPFTVDLPQRFGDEPYSRLDPGQSFVRADLGPVAAGFSTAAETWGPGVVHPLLLGQSAPGVPHVFLGTSGMVGVGIGRVGGRLVLGRPGDSPFPPPNSPRRYMVGGVATFAPRFAPGLEVGTGRIFHRIVPAGGLGIADLFTVFEGFFQSEATKRRKNDPTSPDYTPDNQIATVFASWTFPTSGLRAYGEVLKNDNNLDFRELLTEPDHDFAYLLGIEHALSRGTDGRALVVARAEVLNARRSHLERVRAQVVAYEHGAIVQGHTSRGAVLGSIGMMGGGATHLGLDRYTRQGRVSFLVDRVVRRQPVSEGASADQWDVQHALGAEAVRFAGALEWSGRVRFVHEMNRDYGDDATNWQLALGVTYRPDWRVGTARAR